jgi:hypothetical protein
LQVRNDSQATDKADRRAGRATSALPAFGSRLSLPALLLSQHSWPPTFWNSEHCGEQTDDVEDEQMHDAIDFDLQHRKNKFTDFRELKRSGQLAATAGKLAEAELRL